MNAVAWRTARFRRGSREALTQGEGYRKYAGQEIKLDGKEYLIMKEDDVLAVIEGETKKKLVVKGKIKKKK